MGLVFNERLRPKAEVCGLNRAKFEIGALARIFRVATGDVTISDAYFRTVDLPGGDQAGRVYITFVKREGEWRVMTLRFHSLRFEKPIVGIEAASRHDAAGPDGWVQLFDGASTGAFLDAGGGAFPGTWKVEDGALKAVAGQNRSLRTRDTYRSFELRFEWKAPPKGNSGIKYRLFYLLDGALGSDGTGLEYQIADDAGDPGAIQFAVERSGGLYNQIAPRDAVPKPLGEYNQGAIVVNGRRVEHWLNGVKVMAFEAESAPPESPIVIQHHGTEMWFRDIRIRRLDQPAAEKR